jgi:hypothetical protein
MNLAELLWQLDPDRDAHPAVVDGESITTYGQLRTSSEAVAAALAEAARATS